MEGDQEQSKTCKSVFAVTKDLIESEEKETDKGVDWGWGDDTPANDNAQASLSDNDTASTAECDSDSENENGSDEEEESLEGEIHTQPPFDNISSSPTSPQQNVNVSSAHDVEEETDCQVPPAQPPTVPNENTENDRSALTTSDKGHDDSSAEEKHYQNDDEPTVSPCDDTKTMPEDSAALDSNHDDNTEPEPQPPSPESHHDVANDALLSSSPHAARRSTRPTKMPKRLLVEESEKKPIDKRDNRLSSNSNSNPEREDDATKQKSPVKKALASEGGQQPPQEDLLRSTDFLFLQANKDSVTVADICRALSAEYDCKLSKQNKKRVREHLIDLMKGNVVPQVADPMEEDEASEQGDVHSEMSDQDLDSHSPSDSDSEDEEEKPSRAKKLKSKSKKQQPKLKRSKPKKKKSLAVSPSRDRVVEEDDDNQDDQISEQGDAMSDQSEFEEDGPSDEDEEHGPTKSKRNKKSIKSQSKKLPKSKPPNQRKAAKVARMVEAERLRKKRMEELRIRNEEMQLNQSKEEQERAEAIAAKFETNTDELRLKRLEDRLTLLELLDQKRIAVIDALESKIEATNTAEKSEFEKPQENNVEADDNAKSDEESDSSSDEEELDIIGLSKPLKPLKPIHTHLPSQALNLLKQVQNPKAKTEQVLPKMKEQNILSSPTQGFNSIAVSPTKAMDSRNYLRDFLKRKQRKQGNLWLARELGYKTEEEHLKDCQLAADNKWALVRKKEHARIDANERKQLRERLLRQGDETMGEEQDEQADQGSDEENEEDEEQAMARDLEKEAEMKLEEDGEETQVPQITTGNQDGPDGDEENEEEALQEVETATVGVPNSQEAGQSLPAASSVEASKGEVEESGLSTIATSKVANTDATNTNLGPAKEVIERKGEEEEVPDSSEDLQSTNEGFPNDDDDEEDGEQEFDDNEPQKDSNRPRNSAWQAMLKKEAEMLKKQKQKRKQGLVEDQAEEEEEEEVAGLEDFGFSIKKKKQDDDDDDLYDDKLDEDDLKHVVDDVSDGEGDEEAGEEARKRQQRLEEKERHREIMRRMREGYDGRRGGIAGSGVGARGVHRFDQLVAADNREDAKRLGLLNDDELDSEDEAENNEDKGGDKGDDDNEDDEAALLDKMLKDRFLHRANVDLEENFSDDEEGAEEMDSKSVAEDSEAEEERAQERLARRFAKRARMQRLEEEFAESQEFSQQRLIDEDEKMRQELSQMKNGLVRNRSVSSSTRSSSLSSQEARNTTIARPPLSTIGETTIAEKKSVCLSIALRASRTTQGRTTFMGGAKSGKTKESGALIHKSVSLGHVIFASANRVPMSNGGGNIGEKRQRVTAPGIATGGH